MSNGFPLASDTRNSWPLVLPSNRSGAATPGADVLGPERLIETAIKIAMAAAAPPPISHHLALCQMLAEV